MIIGVNTSHDAAFCILDERGRVRWLLEEERFNRFKHTGYFSLHGLERLIDEGLLDPAGVEVLAYGFEVDEEEVARLELRLDENVRRDFGDAALRRVRASQPPPEPYLSATAGLGQTRAFDDTEAALRALFPAAAVEAYNHHHAHAASAFFPSPFREAAVLVVDGAGRLETATIWAATNQGIELVHRVELPHSLGFFYWVVAHVLALEEGKVMGLAAYGTPRYADRLREGVIAATPDGGFRLRAPLLFWGTLSPEWACDELLARVPVPRRFHPGDPLTQAHADLAASAQRVTEEVILHLATTARERTGSRHLCMAGGVMQNCVALGHVIRAGLFEDHWIQPAPHDAGCAWGAALLAAHSRGRPEVDEPAGSAFLGRELADGEVEAALAATGLGGERVEAPAEDAAALLDEGGVIGWIRGRAEAGPRALGARSLLAHPRFALNHFRLNRIKGREPWRPLAPVFLERDLARFVCDGRPTPAMNVSYPVRPEAAQVLPAATHVDGTARIQTVRAGDGGDLSLILRALDLRGAPPILLNTSLNGRDEPLVQGALDGLRCFVLTEMDALYLDGWKVSARPAVTPELRRALSANRHLERYHRLLRGRRALLLRGPATVPERLEDLERSLRWIGVDVVLAEPGSLTDLPPDPPAILSLAPAADLAAAPPLEGTAAECATWVFVADDLYPTAVPLEALRARIAANLGALEDAVGGRRLVALMEEPAWARFRAEAPDLGRGAARAGGRLPEPEPARDYLLFSPGTYGAHRCALGLLRPGADFGVWADGDSRLHAY